jgi:hypothetical protein
VEALSLRPDVVRAVAVLLLALGAFLWQPMSAHRGIPGPRNSLHVRWHYPVLFDAAPRLVAGHLPFWNPRLGTGYPVWGADGGFFANPLFWISPGSPDRILNWLVVFHALLACASFCAFARLRGYAAELVVLGGVLYAGNTWFVARLFDGEYGQVFAAALLPMVAGLGLRAAETRSPSFAWKVAVSSAPILLVSGVWMWAVTLLVVAGCVVVRAETGVVSLLKRRSVPGGVGAMVLVASAAACTLLPRLEFLAHSTGVEDPASPAGFFPASALLGFLVPGFFGGGTVPFWSAGNGVVATCYLGLLAFLPLVGLISASREERVVPLRALAAIVGILLVACIGGAFSPGFLALCPPESLLIALAFGSAWSVLWAVHLVLNNGLEAPGRAAFLYACLTGATLGLYVTVAVLPGSSWESLVRVVGGDSSLALLLSTGAAHLVRLPKGLNSSDDAWLALAPVLKSEALSICMRQALLSAVLTVGFLFLRRFPGHSRAVLLLALFAVIDLRFAADRHISVTTLVDCAPPGSIRAVAAQDPSARFALPASPGVRNVPLLAGGGTAWPDADRHLEWVAAAFDYQPVLAPGARARCGEESQLRYAEASGVAYLQFPVASVPPVDVSRLETIGSDGREVLYRIAAPPPRARLLHRVSGASSRQDAVARTSMRDWTGVDVFVVGGGALPPLPANPPVSTGEVSVRHEQDDDLSLEVNGQLPGLVVLADPVYPGWRAWVNHAESEVVAANGWMRAVAVDSGASVVRMRFEPGSFRLGLFLTLAAAAVLAVLLTKRLTRLYRTPWVARVPTGHWGDIE